MQTEDLYFLPVSCFFFLTPTLVFKWFHFSGKEGHYVSHCRTVLHKEIATKWNPALKPEVMLPINIQTHLIG